jgi:hypothetical protein
MTDKELLQQLLRRNHQLTAQATAMDLKLRRLEKVLEELFKQGEMNHHAYCEMIDNYWEKTQILSVITDWVVQKLGGDFDSFYDQAKNIVDKERLQMQFEEDTTEKEDGHS